MIKLIITAGKNLKPNNAGTQKLNAIKLVKFGGCGINLLAAKAKKIPKNIFQLE